MAEIRSKATEERVKKLDNQLQVHMAETTKKLDSIDSKIDDLGKKMDLMSKLFPTQDGVVLSCHDKCSSKKEKHCMRSIDCECDSCMKKRESKIEIIKLMVESAYQEDQPSADVSLIENDNVLNRMTVEVSHLKNSLNVHLEYIPCERHRMEQFISGFECDIVRDMYKKDCESNGSSLKLFDELPELDVLHILCLFDDFSSHVDGEKIANAIIVFDPGGIMFDSVNYLKELLYGANIVVGSSFPFFVYSLHYAESQLANNARAENKWMIRQFNEFLDFYSKNIKSAVGGLQNGLVASLLGWDVIIGVVSFGDENSIVEMVLVDKEMVLVDKGVTLMCSPGVRRSNTKSYLRWKHLLMFKNLLERHHLQQLASTVNYRMPTISWSNNLLLSAILRTCAINYRLMSYEQGMIPWYLTFWTQVGENRVGERPNQKICCEAFLDFVVCEFDNWESWTMKMEFSVDLQFQAWNLSFHDCTRGGMVKIDQLEANCYSYLLVNDINIYKCSLYHFSVVVSSYDVYVKLHPLSACSMVSNKGMWPGTHTGDGWKLEHFNSISGNYAFIIVVFDPGGYDTSIRLNIEAYQVEYEMKLLYMGNFCSKLYHVPYSHGTMVLKYTWKMASLKSVTEMVLGLRCSVHMHEVSSNLICERDSYGYWGMGC